MTKSGISFKRAVLASLAGAGLAVAAVWAGALHADTFPATAKSDWARYFPGEPVVPDPELNLAAWIASPSARCSAIQQTVITQTMLYGKLGFASDNSGSKKEAEKTIKLLRQLEDSGDECFETAARTYIAAALHLMEPSNSNVGGNVNNYRVVTLGKERSLPDGLELTLLGAALLNHRRSDGSFAIQLLTPKRRSQDLPEIWSRRLGNKKPYLVSAGYDCAGRMILIDPYLMPVDLGGTFVHELDHFFRDRVTLPPPPAPLGLSLLELEYKLGGLEMPKLFATGHALDGHLTLEVSLDETLATVVSGDYERHLRWFHDYKASFLKGLVFKYGGTYPLPFRLSGDLTLFRSDKDSPINQMWELIAQASRKPKGEINISAGYFLDETFLRGDPETYRSQPRPLREAPLKQIHEVYQIVRRGYFNGMSASEDDLSLLDPSLHGLADDPLTQWLDRYRIEPVVDNQKGYDHAAILTNGNGWIRTIPAADMGFGAIDPSRSVIPVAYDLNPFFKGLDLAFSQLFEPESNSPYCERYLKGLADGELADYVGTSLSSGFKPGDTGVKGALVRPCLNIGREF